MYGITICNGILKIHNSNFSDLKTPFRVSWRPIYGMMILNIKYFNNKSDSIEIKEARKLEYYAKRHLIEQVH